MEGNTNDFGAALNAVKNGKRVARAEWKNARLIFLVQGSTFHVNRAPLNEFYPEGTLVQYRPHIDMVGADGLIGTWTPSMVDLMASDWFEVTG